MESKIRSEQCRRTRLLRGFLLARFAARCSRRAVAALARSLEKRTVPLRVMRNFNWVHYRPHHFTPRLTPQVELRILFYRNGIVSRSTKTARSGTRTVTNMKDVNDEPALVDGVDDSVDRWPLAEQQVTKLLVLRNHPAAFGVPLQTVHRFLQVIKPGKR